MKKVRILLFLSLAVAMLVAVTVASADPQERFKPGDQTIAQIASNSGDFDTLVAALSCTGLVGAVANPDAELTVFAPNDAAFFNTAGLTPDNVCSAFSNEDLKTILLYHVVGERRPSPSVINGKNKSISMMAGGNIYPAGQGSTMVYDNLGRAVTITAPDQMASNGIIHVVNYVLLPFAP